MVERICDGCIHLLKAKYRGRSRDIHEIWKCDYGKELLEYQFFDCNHFMAIQELNDCQKETQEEFRKKMKGDEPRKFKKCRICQKKPCICEEHTD